MHGFSLRGNDYIPKPFYPEELVAKINERFAKAQSQVYKLGSTSFNPSLYEIEFKGKTTTLTMRQSQILELLTSNFGAIVDRNTILQSIWGDDSHANSLALNVQITYLRNILKDDNTITITSLKGRGYVLK